MALPGSGIIWMTQIRDEFRPGQAVYDLYSYYKGHGIIGNNPENARIQIDPNHGSISFSQFHGALKSYGGAWDQGTPGYYEIWVPSHAWLRIRAWGGGGGGSVDASDDRIFHYPGSPGGASVVHGYLQGNGGGAGMSGVGGGGAGGGNQENITGGAPSGSIGGGSPGGGAGGSSFAQGGGWPGGGGAGYMAPGGGGGGYAHSYWGAGYGRTIGITVGAGGGVSSGAAGRGGNGRVLIEWGV